MTRWIAPVAVLLVGLAGLAPDARADGPYEGVWNAGATNVRVDTRSWGPDCGPRPRSTTVPSPGNVRVSQSGDHLTFHGRSMQRTDQCWSDNRAVRRVSSSHQAGVWRTVCRTPEEDSRSETGTYTLRAASEDRLEFVDVSRYDWQLNESRCLATITSRQVFTRVGGGPASTPEPEPEPSEPSCTPGDPARLVVRPASATIEPGQQLRMRARVVDAAGCPVRGRSVRWELRRPDGASGTLEDGVFTAASTAAEAEGTFTVEARSGGVTGRAEVTVRTADLSDLIAKRTSGGLVQASDDEEDATGESAAGVVARPEEESSLLWPIAGVATALMLLGGVMLLLLGNRRRSRRARTDPDDDGGIAGTGTVAAGSSAAGPVASTAAAPGSPRVCPVCHQERTDPAVEFCPADGARLVDPAAAAGGQALICPTCRRGFGEGTRRCPTDDDELLPYAVFVERHQRRQAGQGEKTKICPQCGDRYALTVTFCGKDGTELVLVN